MGKRRTSLGAWVAASLLLLGTPAPGAETATVSPIDEIEQILDDGDAREAERRSREFLEELQDRDPQQPLDESRVLDVLVESLWRGGKSNQPETRELAERALRVKRNALGPGDAGLATSLDNLAHVFRAVGQYDESRRYFEEGLRLREASLGPDHVDVAHSLNQLGWVLYNIGEFSRAKAMGQRSVEIRERVLGVDPDVASSMNNLAIYLKTLGDYSGARLLYEKALSIYESTLGPEHGQVASSLNNLAILLKSQGELATAIELHERSIRVGEKTLGPDHPTVAQGLGNLAGLYMHMGNHPTATRLYLRALGILEGTLGPDNPRLAGILNSLGRQLTDAGDPKTARGYLERALEIREAAHGPEHTLVGRVLNNLGHLEVSVGDLAAAKKTFERSYSIMQSNLGPDHPDSAEVLEKLGDVLHRSGEHTAARERFVAALAVYERNLGPDHPSVAKCLQALSSLLLDMNQLTPALQFALRADEIGREHLRLTARTLPERQALAYALARPAGQDVAFSVLARQQKSTSETTTDVWNAVIRSRALVLDEMRTRRRAMSQAEQPARRLARASEQLANLLVRGPGRQTTEQYRTLLLAAAEERDAAERALAEASLSFRRTNEATRYVLADVAAALPDRSALVAYVRYERQHVPEPQPSYMALVLRSGSEPVAVHLGTEEEIEPLVSRWRDQIAAARTRIPALSRSGDARYRQSGEELRNFVWDPIATRVGSSDRVFVVPDGLLHLVNLGTLPVADGAYLIETAPPIHYLSTERDLIRGDDRPVPGRGLLLAGGPDFGTASAPGRSTGGNDCTDFDSLRFSPLPGTIKEIDAVASLWTNRHTQGPQARVLKLQGAEATEDAFKEQAGGYQVLHLATHGFFVNERCETGARTPNAEGTIRSLAPPADDETTVLAGLALAGANLRNGSNPEGSDGILTAQEIASIDLTGVEWVVLSACDSALGTIRAGEGVFGLRRAFQIAGAETLITSLWSVEDASGRAWTRRLYEARLDGLGSAEAVHRASLGILEARRRDRQSTHPFYWGAFVAVGDWR
jgi:CHAT domain-containing protein/Tfp pilus assembly protein PilF